MGYVVIRCLSCANPTIAKEGQKSRACPYCGRRIKISHATKIEGYARTPREARSIVAAVRSSIPISALLKKPTSTKRSSKGRVERKPISIG